MPPWCCLPKCLLIAAVFIGVAGDDSPAGQCEKLVDDNKTCILAENKCTIDWPGQLVIPKGRSLVCSESVAYSADRFVMESGANVYTGASVHNNGTATIRARSFDLNNAVIHSESIQLSGKDGAPCTSVHMVDVVLDSASTLVIRCLEGTVNVTGKSILQAAKQVNSKRSGGGKMSLEANFILMPDFMVKLKSDQINVSAQQLTLASSLGPNADLMIISQHEAILGWTGGSWTVGSLILAAENLVFATDHRVEVLGNSCRNHPLPSVESPCHEWLKRKWPWSLETLSGSLRSVSNLQFTSVIFAFQRIEMKPRTRILSGSAMFCAGEAIYLDEESSVVSRGMGCQAYEGEGRGEVRGHFALCGGGGASNIGAGGDGANRIEGEKALDHCASKGFVTAWHSAADGLPLGGASGGGCRQPFWAKTDLSGLSSGGGLLWLSTAVLFMNTSTVLTADGSPGTTVGRSQTFAMACGGGAGGQILIFVEEIRVESACDRTIDDTGNDVQAAPKEETCELPELTAKGGDAECNSAQSTVGGAGGGGFIGLWWLGGAPKAHGDLGKLLKLDVDGGTLTKTCADVLPQDLHREVFGSAGRAESLALCPQGHAGPFCAYCPIGKWGDGVACHDCHNKPDTPNAVYKWASWPNSTCPFQCVQGVPEVNVNPKCLSTSDFAMGFFGGQLGFRMTLGSFLCIFFLLRLGQWLRRQGKRKRLSCGRWQFPREELPCHVHRIFLLGNNSPGSPWTLPQRAAPLPDAAIARLLDEDVWQLLGEALEKPLKIGSWESWRLLQLSPWVLLLLRRLRLHRAVRAQRTVQGLELWKEVETCKPCMKFGCDDSATTGYLDIFDFARSPLDWAPRNLQEEEEVILAQGAGTWFQPYALNIADPMLLGVAQSQGSGGPIGSQTIYSLVCSFNLFSRIVPAQELLDVLWGDEAPAFALLQQEVESSARRLGLQAAAQVQIVRMSRCPKGQPVPESEVVGTVGHSAPKAADVSSFTDLVQQLPLEAVPPRSTARQLVEEELRLCLVLRAEKDQRLLRQDGSEDLPAGRPQGFFYCLRRSFLRFRAERLLRWVRLPTAKFGISNLFVSLIFFLLILFEGMASVVLASTCSRLDIGKAFWLWLLFPSPLAPLSPFVGLAALLLRGPLLCRLQAQLSLMASINVVVVTAAYYQQEGGLLAPSLTLLAFHAVVCYMAAIYSGLEMSIADVESAEDSGGDASLQSLRDNAGAAAPGPVPATTSHRAAKAAEDEGICMALWQPRSPARPHADSADSDVGLATAATPF